MLFLWQKVRIGEFSRISNLSCFPSVSPVFSLFFPSVSQFFPRFTSPVKCHKAIVLPFITSVTRLWAQFLLKKTQFFRYFVGGVTENT